MTDGTWAEGVARFEAVHRERYARGGYVSGLGEGVPIRFDPTNEYLMTAKQASALARDVLQAINDATPTAAEWVADRQLAEPMNHCHQCGRPILIMINRGTGWCSEQCRKALADE